MWAAANGGQIESERFGMRLGDGGLPAAERGIQKLLGPRLPLVWAVESFLQEARKRLELRESEPSERAARREPTQDLLVLGGADGRARLQRANLGRGASKTPSSWTV